MEDKKKYEVYKLITPGTAGVAQRMEPSYESVKTVSEKSRLFALIRNEVVPCGQNQY
jgi:hypothetical protein